MLLWSGARCCTNTKAIPGSVSMGMPEKKASKAANPPADAPIPTIGNEKDSDGEVLSRVIDSFDGFFYSK